MLIAAGLIALAVNIVRRVTGGEADFLECVGVFVAIALSVVISVVMEGRSAKAFEALSKINADMTVRAVRDGQTVTLQSAHLAVGDVVLLSAGDKVPADGRLLESTALRVDESALTGESFPVKKDSELVLTDEKTPLAERANMLYSGTFVTEGNGRLLVTAVGDATEFGKIAGELGNAEKKQHPLAGEAGPPGQDHYRAWRDCSGHCVCGPADFLCPPRRPAFGGGDGGVHHQYRADCGGGAGGAAHHCGGVFVYQYYQAK